MTIRFLSASFPSWNCEKILENGFVTLIPCENAGQARVAVRFHHCFLRISTEALFSVNVEVWIFGFPAPPALGGAKRRDRIIAAKSDFCNDFSVFPGSSDLCAALMDGCPF
ncbi:MAG: hypothetical protein M9955_21325 [Rhizobiaceae bacterium]|nr:hypothetical protein [Rhizobiaceae bacterium]